MSVSLKTEVKRKLFHLLNLVYLVFYHVLGMPRILWLMGAWMIVEGGVEGIRLRYPAVNKSLMDVFGHIQRGHEESGLSGIFWTAAGCWLVFFFFGDRPEVVNAVIFYLAFGDMVAALVGRGIGRIPIGFGGRHKTLEGSLACFAACIAAGVAAGLRGRAVFLGALSATVLELLPLPLDDNLWMPLGAGALLWFCC